MTDGYKPSVSTRLTALLLGPLLIVTIIATWLIAFIGIGAWLAGILILLLGGLPGWLMALHLILPAPITYGLLKGFSLLGPRMSITVQGYWAAVALGMAGGLAALTVWLIAITVQNGS